MARGWFDAASRADLDSVATLLGLYLNKIPNVLMETRGLMTLPTELGFKLGLYCIRDVQLCRRAYDKFIELGYPSDELKIIHHTIKAFTEPKLQLNKANINREIARLTSVREAQMFQAAEILGVALPTDALKILGSNPKFALALKQLGIEPPRKISPVTDKETYAFAKSDLEFQALLVHE